MKIPLLSAKRHHLQEESSDGSETRKGEARGSSLVAGTGEDGCGGRGWADWCD